MTFNRRDFLTAGVVTASVGMIASPEPATAATLHAGRSVLDFGVQTGSDANQTTAIQKAIDEISQSGHPVFFPAGHYTTGALKIPAACAITGIPGASVLRTLATDTLFEVMGAISLSGLVIDGATSGKDKALVTVVNGDVNLTYCRFVNAPWQAVHLEKCSGIVHAIHFETADVGLHATESGTLAISHCQFSNCRAGGMKVTSVQGANGAIISQNHAKACGEAGIAVEGNSVVTGNIVAGSFYGVKLGGEGSGHILATGNLLQNCNIGIGVTASGETIFASLNLIHAPKDAGIRPFIGNKQLSPDLVRQSAESFPNLTVAGNVVR